MRYDRDGFPIPADFDSRSRADDLADERSVLPPFSGAPLADWAPPQRGSGRVKRTLIMAVLGLGLVPALVGPQLMPEIRMAVVRMSVDRALRMEAEDDVAGALAEVDRALEWLGGEEDGSLLCQRAWLRLHNGDPAGAIEDARRAESLAPGTLMPLRVRGLAAVVGGNPDQALADAAAVVERSAPGDPDALNHRAYIRALVGRELPEALADIDAAIGQVGPAVSAELLDTRGYILHLLDRDQEALEQMNEAIERMLQDRRRVRLVADHGEIDPVVAGLRFRTIEHGLAVMYHHRGLICRRVGHDEQARQDFDAARVKGYDPSRGVF
ncbi:MAG: hypothetical protein EBR86_09650 [Planctomycetia bacterium]|nr:hypothetical protein [Planctomycetia bacterium]